MDEWLVSDKTCKGCKYYGRLGWKHSAPCCDYTPVTGRVRKCKPSECEVKDDGKKANMHKKTTDRMFNPKKKNMRGRKNGRSKMD